MMEPWRIQLLGELRVSNTDRTVTRFRSRKAALLLAYLSFYSRAHPREELIELLWPESTPHRGRTNLRTELSSLRRQLEPPDVLPGAVLVADHPTVRLNAVAWITDVAQFEAALRAAERAESRCAQRQRLEQSVGLYRGALLPGFFENWVLLERERLAQAYLQALDQLVALEEQQGELLLALRWARKSVHADPLREESHHSLIRLLAASGQAEAACRQYSELERLLAQELEVPPSLPLSALLDRAECPPLRAESLECRNRQQRPVDRKDQTEPESVSSEAVPSVTVGGCGSDFRLQSSYATSPLSMGRLPLQFTRFFGRKAEIQRLRQQLLNGEARLVTLSGPGGSGKTRLSLEVAQSLREPFQEAIWFVSFRDLADPRLISDRLREGLGLTGSPRVDPLAQAVAFLSLRPSLLLLDNFEHMVPEGKHVVRVLLEQVEMLTLLVTSRHLIDLEGEYNVSVLPLPIPSAQPSGEHVALGCRSEANDAMFDFQGAEPLALMSCPSVQLFVDRAQAVRSDFQLTKANAAAVAGICCRLEGLPLALELAATRVGVLTPHQILNRLQQRFELLVRRGRSADPRHQSLRAALDWSFELLPPEAQRFFVWLAVFRGGWTLEAADAICGEEGTPTAVHQTLDFLERLRGCSLVQTEETDSGRLLEVRADRRDATAQETLAVRMPNDLRCPIESEGSEMRFRLLETLREYAAEQLDDPARAVLERRHAEYYLALAERAEARWASVEQRTWYARLERDHDNLRAALDWTVRSGELETGLRLAGALWWFWEAKGHLAEGRERLEQLLTLSGAAMRTAPRAKALACSALLAFRHSDLDASNTFAEASLELGQELGNPWVIAMSLRCLGQVKQCRFDEAGARSLLEESLSVWHGLGNQWGVAMSLNRLANLALWQGDHDRASHLEEQGLAIRRALGDEQGIATSLSELGMAAHLRGDLETARALLEEGLALRRSLGTKLQIAFSLSALGPVVQKQGDHATAQVILTEGVAIWRSMGARAYLADALSRLGDVACGKGDYQEAEALYAECLRIVRDVGNPAWIPGTLCKLGSVALHQHDKLRAMRHFTESLKLLNEWENERSLGACLTGLARLACGELSGPRTVERCDRAARLLGAADALRKSCRHRLYPPERADYDAVVALLRATLGEGGFVERWMEGQSMPLEQVMRIAFEESSDLPDGGD